MAAVEAGAAASAAALVLGLATAAARSVVLVIIAVFAVIFVVGAVASVRERRKRRQRRERVHAASAEAAQDDDYLAAERVEQEAADLWLATQAAWDARDEARLSQLVGEDLMVEWRRRLADFQRKGWHNRVQVTGRPTVQYVGLVNREDDDEDRVTVHIAGDMNSYVQTEDGEKIMRDGASSEAVSITEYWTLARRGDGWLCVSIEQEAEGGHHLDAPIVATPEADTERIRGQAVTELAAADAVPEGFTTADLAVFDFQGTRARGGAGPVAGRRPVRPRRAGGGRPPRGGGVGRGGGRRGRRAGRRGHARRAAEAALRRRPQRQDPAGAARRRACAASASRAWTPRPPPRRCGWRSRWPPPATWRTATPPTWSPAARTSVSTFTEHWTMALDGPEDSPWRLVATA